MIKWRCVRFDSFVNAQGLGLPIAHRGLNLRPSQVEVTFDPRPALEQADNMIFLFAQW